MSRKKLCAFSAVTVCLFLGGLELTARLLLPARYHQRLISDVVTLIGIRASAPTPVQLHRRNAATLPANFSGDWHTVPVHSIGDPWGFPDMRTVFNETGVRTNSAGYRGKELPSEPSTTHTRILCLGDSITFGYGVRENDTYCARLGEMGFEGSPVETFNAGIPGKTSAGGLMLLKRDWLALRPDIVIVQYLLNDLTIYGQSLESKPSPWMGWAFLVLHRSAAYNFLSDSVRRFTADPLTSPGAHAGRYSPDVFRDHLVEFTRLAAEHRVRLIMLTSPIVYHLPLHDAYTDVIREVGAATSTLVVDAAPFLRAHSADTTLRTAFEAETNWLDAMAISPFGYIPRDELEPYYYMYVDPVHPGREGHRLLAQAVYDILAPLAARSAHRKGENRIN